MTPVEDAVKICQKLIATLEREGALLPDSGEKIRETFRLYTREAQEREDLLVDLKNREIAALEEQLREAHRQTLFVNEVGQQITASLDLDAIIRTFHRSVRHQIPADRILLATRRGGGEELFYRYYGDSTQEEKGMDSIFISAAHQLVIRSLTDGRTLIENHLVPEKDCFLTRRGGSVLIFPLKTGSVLLGALVLHSDQEDAYQENHHQLLESLSLFLGVSISNALSHQDVAALNEELQGERAELIASYTRITRMANYDSLTDLPNLRLLNEFLPRYMNQALRRG
jgi:GAF domain-containing protein